MKEQARLVGFDDGPFTFEDETCTLAGVMTRGGGYVEGVLVGEVAVDGTDATDTVLSLLEGTGFPETAHAVAFNGGTVGGFNVLDLDRLNTELGLPVLAVTTDEPDPQAVRQALDAHADDPERRARLLEAQPVHEIEAAEGPLYLRHAGGSRDELAELVRLQTVRGREPEPLRIAHLVARAVARGRSV